MIHMNAVEAVIVLRDLYGRFYMYLGCTDTKVCFGLFQQV